MLRAAIVGAGNWGVRLIESVQGSDKFRFVSAVTRNPAGRGALAEKYRLALTANYAEVLADPQIDAVVLATPHSQHADEIVAAAKAGKHVLAEKPFTLTRASAERAVAACAQVGITLGVGFNRRFAPAYVALSKRIAEIGALRHIEGQFSGPASYQTEPGNWRANRTESPGGSMTARGVHLVDAMSALAGPVAGVFALSTQRELDIDVDDTTSALLHFRDGATGYLGTLHHSTQFWRIHAFGTKGSLEMRGENELLFIDPMGSVTPTKFPATDKERDELEAFADAVAAGVKFTIQPELIVNNVAVLEAVEQSAKKGEAINISA